MSKVQKASGGLCVLLAVACAEGATDSSGRQSGAISGESVEAGAEPGTTVSGDVQNNPGPSEVSPSLTTPALDPPPEPAPPCTTPTPPEILPPEWIDYQDGSCGAIGWPNSNNLMGQRCLAGTGGAHGEPRCIGGFICTEELAPLGAEVDGVKHCTKPCVADEECGTGSRCCAPKGLPSHESAGPIRFCFIEQCAHVCADE